MSFKLHAVLSSMMQSLVVLLHLTCNMIAPLSSVFTLYMLLTLSQLLATYVLTVHGSQCLCSSNIYFT
jgi:hypothetical protein